MRDKIAAALDGLVVDGITPAAGLAAEPYTPRTLLAWQAWPEWLGAQWSTRCISDLTWHVIVLLPAGDITAWIPAADALLTPVREALEASVGHVTRVEPVTVAAGDASTAMPGLRFYLTTPAAG